MTYAITHISEIKNGQTYRHINKNTNWRCIRNDPGSLLVIRDDDLLQCITYNPNIIDTERDMYVMAEVTPVEEEPQRVEYLTNKLSNVTHLVIDDRIVCGHRFIQHSVSDGVGTVTCQHCLELLQGGVS